MRYRRFERMSTPSWGRGMAGVYERATGLVWRNKGHIFGAPARPKMSIPQFMERAWGQ